MKKGINVVVLGAIVKDDTFLLTKRIHLDPEDKPDFHNAWQLPGGGLEFGEEPETTLHRELKEEVGLDIKIIKMIPKIYTEIRGPWQGIFIVYLCHLKYPGQKITLNDEASDYSWLTLKQARKINCLPGTAETIKDAISFNV